MADAKKKRNDGPLKVEFQGSDGTFATRVPNDVVMLRVTERATDQHTDFKLSEVPSGILMALAAAGLKRYVETNVRNAVTDKGLDVLEAADNVFSNIRDGRVYTRTGKGGPKERVSKFDMDFLVAVIQRYNKRMGKEYSEDAIERFKNSMLSKTHQERTKWISQLRKSNPHFDTCYKMQDAVRADHAAKANAAPAAELDLFA